MLKKSWTLVALIGLTAIIALRAPAAEPASPAPASLLSPLPIPDQADAIALPHVSGTPASAEQWENFHGQRTVRNVTAPTLTPVLPDPAKATGAAVIVAPGGAFRFLSIDNEGFAVAHWLADHGVAAFVLKYRTVETPVDTHEYFIALGRVMRPNQKAIATPPEAVEDGKAAVRLVREQAAQWAIDPMRVGFLGFSAGAMTALEVGLTDDKTARPDFVAPIYGPMEARIVPDDAPPMFLAVALDDPLMAMGKKLDLIESWRGAHRPVEAHFYEHGGHGFGMTSPRAASALWIVEFHAWMVDHGLLKARN